MRDLLGLELGKVVVSAGDARDVKTWPISKGVGSLITSPPYLPASSGREHYASSRALAFAVLGFSPGEHGYYDAGPATPAEAHAFSSYPEAARLLHYLHSDASESADPQRDAMRFLRKAVPTHHYLNDISAFLRSAQGVLHPQGRLMLVVAHQHTFYSHRRQEIEHVVSGDNLYSQIAAPQGLALSEAIAMELLKSAASRARPRAKDDYFETVLVLHASQEAEATPTSAIGSVSAMSAAVSSH